MQQKEFSNYLVPSEKILSAEHFFRVSNKYPEIIFKPSFGCGGENVYYTQKNGAAFRVLLGTEETVYDNAEMTEFIGNKIKQEDYIVQPYINCRTKAGEPYDFRLHVQKDGKGEWVTSCIYPRISSGGSIVCNIRQGGHTNELTGFLKREFGTDHAEIKKIIEDFALRLAAHMDDIQKKLYKEELDELGIDIGLDESRRIHIYEVNWRPGHPPFINIDLNVIKNTVRYAIFLANRKAEFECLSPPSAGG